jgi:hypothetical protein
MSNDFDGLTMASRSWAWARFFLIAFALGVVFFVALLAIMAG